MSIDRFYEIGGCNLFCFLFAVSVCATKTHCFVKVARPKNTIGHISDY